MSEVIPKTNMEKLRHFSKEGKLSEWESNFANSVITQLEKKGDLSEKQWSCIAKIVDQAENPKKPAFLSESTKVANMSGVVALMNKVKGFPKLWFKLSNDRDLCIYKATDRSKYAGQLQLTGGKFGSAYYGRITQEGELFTYPEGKEVEKELTSLLTRLGSNPAEVASEYGKLTGTCSFCHRKLSDERSKEVGYGATCASNYELPWGKVA